MLLRYFTVVITKTVMERTYVGPLLSLGYIELPKMAFCFAPYLI
jgi:hypothetical protein